ncbi:MAG: type II toxin-antitoxin system Phd/YefM family antitoxin [Mesorhizobium sp.]|uniref:type II toxin-antitoxin system Phd/YefM family antitoxin n=1 Tax=Mesorhizobium sp. TaxID=1871066 RepID=UPI000FE5AD16|nr:type II toxin-antitoxin system prevent-host-death family antitoxin [Mesorhizobium sp.]RWA70718.1 MAG: type II toxin-antitoxin system Phd/YefM family antitoxin [Mesorhizobium sp.]RWC03175.1 MAG: type II toxin-antitoxin system Phd/YefM family antitoxin [Mesorhizobium sp.]TIQ42467.1 MAG: type II toxin-antitoxin system Phd/YefM family antitoxin [Mesorhizobium sp.]
MNIPMAKAKAQLSELVKRAQAGEEIHLTRHGEIVATLSAPARPGGSKGLFGALKGQIRIADDFDELGPEWDEYIK